MKMNSLDLHHRLTENPNDETLILLMMSDLRRRGEPLTRLLTNYGLSNLTLLKIELACEGYSFQEVGEYLIGEDHYLRYDRTSYKRFTKFSVRAALKRKKLLDGAYLNFSGWDGKKLPDFSIFNGSLKEAYQKHIRGLRLSPHLNDPNLGTILSLDLSRLHELTIDFSSSEGSESYSFVRELFKKDLSSLMELSVTHPKSNDSLLAWLSECKLPILSHLRVYESGCSIYTSRGLERIAGKFPRLEYIDYRMILADMHVDSLQLSSQVKLLFSKENDTIYSTKSLRMDYVDG